MTSLVKTHKRLATLSGFILFALTVLLMTWSIVEASTPTLTAQSGTGAVGDLVSIPIVLSEAPSGVSGFDIVVSLSNPSVASIITAEFPDFGLTQYLQISDHEAKLRAVDFGGIIESGASSATLATLTLQGLKRGSTEVQISVNILDDDTGHPIAAEAVSGTLSIKKSAGSGDGGGKGGGRGKK